jgi:hypothetical protein
LFSALAEVRERERERGTKLDSRDKRIIIFIYKKLSFFWGVFGEELVYI